MRRFFSLTFLTAGMVMLQAIALPIVHDNILRAEKKKIILQHADFIEGGQTIAGSYRMVSGNVVFQDGTITLCCDRATDYEQQDKIVLEGHVFMTDKTIEIYGDHGVYDTDRGTGELRGHVRGRMLDNSLAATARRAVVNTATSQILLYDDVLVWHNRQQISGETIFLHLKESEGSGKRKSIDEIQVKGNPFFAAQDTLSLSPIVYDQCSGKKMVILLNNKSKITGITVTSQAEILYHLYDEHQKPVGINYSSGDMIRMFFANGTLNRVKVTGNVEGKQYPERMRGDKSINLATFAWREKENPFKQQQGSP